MDSGDGDVIVLAVDSSAPSDLAFKFYVENVARPGYILHLVHHSNYWGDLEPMDGGKDAKGKGHPPRSPISDVTSSIVTGADSDRKPLIGVNQLLKFKPFAKSPKRHQQRFGSIISLFKSPTPGRCEELIAIENGKVQEIKDRYEEMMAEHNITGQFVVLRGKDTWHDIIQYQEKTHAIMIVLGTRGQNKLRRTFMGSVSDSVVHHAHCPVLVCCHPKIHDDHHHGHKKH